MVIMVGCVDSACLPCNRAVIVLYVVIVQLVVGVVALAGFSRDCRAMRSRRSISLARGARACKQSKFVVSSFHYTSIMGPRWMCIIPLNQPIAPRLTHV